MIYSYDRREAAGKYTFPREFYVPKEVRDKPPETFPGTDLAVWRYESAGAPYAIAFIGKQSKPLWHNRFRSEQHRNQVIDEAVESRRRVLNLKKDRLEEKRNFKHTFEVGDVLVSSWGYDQTNVDFYEVVGVKGADILVREVAQKAVKSDISGDYSVAVKGDYTGSVIRCRPSDSGVKIDGHYARKWNGKPERSTNIMFGH